MWALEWKERAFTEKVNSRCFFFYRWPLLVHQNCTPIWPLHTKLYNGVWNVSANNSETVGYRDLRLGQIVYISVFYDISFSWLHPLDGFHLFFCAAFIAWQWKWSIEQFPGKWYPILDLNSLIYISYARVNCLKTIPFTAAHTYIAHIWQCCPAAHPCLGRGCTVKNLQQVFFLRNWKFVIPLIHYFFLLCSSITHKKEGIIVTALS